MRSSPSWSPARPWWRPVDAVDPGGSGRGRRPPGRLGLLLVLTIGAALLGAGPASAHATLVSTDPAGGAVVPGPVRSVTATFDEQVGVSSDSLRVYDPDGRRVDTGGTRQGETATSIRVDLTPHLPLGTYTVSWQVVSADTHPVQGAFSFSIGHPSRHVADSSVTGARSGSLSALAAVVRGVEYLGFVVVAGGAVFLAWCWPSGARRRRVRRLLLAGWILTVVATLLQLPVQGALAAGRGPGAVLDPHVVPAAFDGRVGIAVVVRVLAMSYLAALVLVLGLAPTDAGPGSRKRFTALFLLVTGFASLTWSIPGHAGVGPQWGLALAADSVHLTSAAVWLGGLALLLGVALRSGQVDSATAETAVRRFSPLAACCVLLIAVTGSYQAWRNTRSWAALLETQYGVLLSAKIVLLAVLVLLGLQGRRILHERPFSGAAAEPPDLGRLRRGVAVEAVAAVAVLGLTAVLVQTPTAQESYHPVAVTTRSFDTGQVRGSLTARLTPARLGANRLTLVLSTTSGTPYTPRQVTAALSLGSEDVGPLPLTLQRTAAGRYRSNAVSLGLRGPWTVVVVVRSGPFDETTVTADLPVS